MAAIAAVLPSILLGLIEEGAEVNSRLFTFAGGESGPWRILNMRSIVGDSLAKAERLDIVSGPVPAPGGTIWLLRGMTSNERYVNRHEKDQLAARQPSLGRSQSTCAALIPIRKNRAWWMLAQDERRNIFEERSSHVQTGLKHLPAIARRLHHCRDVGENEPFDFLTWFEYAPSDSAAFDELVAELRATVEWTYVDREIDIRLARDEQSGPQERPNYSYPRSLLLLTRL